MLGRRKRPHDGLGNDPEDLQLGCSQGGGHPFGSKISSLFKFPPNRAFGQIGMPKPTVVRFPRMHDAFGSPKILQCRPCTCSSLGAEGPGPLGPRIQI